MCFSPEASFTAAAVLGVTGYGALRQAKGVSALIFIALIPLLFALQQFSEGILWLYLEAGDTSSTPVLLAQYSFLFFAMLVWPVWVPFSLWTTENIRWRKWVIGIVCLIGFAWTSANIAMLSQQEIGSSIVYRHIQYSYTAFFPAEIYMAIVIIPCFISSLRHVWIFGILVAVSAYITSYAYDQTFTSVWCFFAAIISVCLYFTVKSARKEMKCDV